MEYIRGDECFQKLMERVKKEWEEFEIWREKVMLAARSSEYCQGVQPR